MRSIRHNQFFFIRTLWGSLYYADWQGAYARWGALGLLIELGRALAGFSAWPFFIPADAGWEPDAVRAILDRYGIPSWGWGYHQREHVCQVPMRQAHWAQYLLQQEGVPIGGRLLAGDGYMPRRTPQRPPRRAPVWAPAHDRTPSRPRKTARGPIRGIHALVDRLADW